MGASRRRRPLQQPGRARPRRLPELRALHRAGSGRRRNWADSAGHHDRDRAPAEHGASGQTGRICRRALGPPGRPALWGMGYFALGDGTAETGAAYLRHYYAFTGPFAQKIAHGNLTSPGAIVDFIRGYEDAGCDELVLFPTAPALDQIDRLAEVIH